MNRIKVAAIGPKPPYVSPDKNPQEIVDFMIDHWKSEFDQVLPDKPDLIVVREACDRPDSIDFPLERRQVYYKQRGDQVRKLFSTVAATNECYVVYSAAAEADDGNWRNSSVVLDRSGAVTGVYHKNHLVMEGEHDEAGLLCGTEAPIIECDFGRVACMICFDLNFATLREKYEKEQPDLLLFSSMYHGNHVVQSWWAYSCRAHMVSAVANLPCEIRNPYGEVIASNSNYRDFAVGTINLDCCMVHYDRNREKLVALKNRYGERVTIHDPGYYGSVLVTSETDDISAVEMVREHEMELLDEYLDRELDLQLSSNE